MKARDNCSWVQKTYEFLTQTDDHLSFINLIEQSFIIRFWMEPIFDNEREEELDFSPTKSQPPLKKQSFSIQLGISPLISNNERLGKHLVGIISDLDNDLEVVLHQNKKLFSNTNSESQSNSYAANVNQNVKIILHQLLFKYIQKLQTKYAKCNLLERI
jgi:hypothetical protein